MAKKKKHLMDVAREMEAHRKPEKKRPELSRDETLQRIGELKAEIGMLYEERKDILAVLHPIEKLIERLMDEKWALEATIVKVKRVSLKAVRERKAKNPLREQLLDAMLSMSPEQLTKLKEEL